MKFLKALDAGFTAFCNELWLPTFGFHLFDDPADALEDECCCPTKECPLEAQDINDEAEAEENEWVHVAGIEGIRGNVPVDVPVERAGSLSAPGDGPEEAQPPKRASSGQPLDLDFHERLIAAWAVADMAERQGDSTNQKVFQYVADKLDPKK